MGTRYHCANDARRQRVEITPAINGLDFVEVMDREAPVLGLRQRVLLLRTFHPSDGAGFTTDHIALSGGVSVLARDISKVALASLPALHAGPLPAAYAPLAATLADLHARIDGDDTDDPSHWWVLLVDPRGDHSPYTLSLTAGGGSDSRPPGFDRVLSEVRFFFKVECPTDLDCAPTEPPPEAPRPAPRLDYLAKDFTSFRRLMLDRLSTTLPEWTERSAADLGVTLVELLAHAGDHVSYFQDAVATEAYLGTARRRVSVRRHARMLDYKLHEGCNARTVVQIQVHTPLSGSPAIATGTPVLSTVSAAPRAIHPDALEEVLGTGPTWFETLHPVDDLHPSHNRIELYTWGDTDCCLPAGATRCSLLDGTGDLKLHLKRGDLVVFEEQYAPDGRGAEGDPARRHVVRLTEDPVALTDDLYGGQPVLDIEWGDADALPFELCLHPVHLEAQGTPDTTAPASVARGNLVLADHGRKGTVPEELEVPNGPHAMAPLAEPELTFLEPYDHDAAIGQSGDAPMSAAGALAQDPRRCVPALSIAEADGGLLWSPEVDLLGSGATNRKFVVEMENDRVAWVRFGDGIHGAMPPQGTGSTAGKLLASYRVGNGPAGNVGPETLTHIVHPSAGAWIQAIRNPVAATSGTGPEDMERARLHAPTAFRVPERAVTEADWADVARRHPSVQRAVATIRWTGSWHTIHVSIDRFGGDEVDEAFQDEMLDFLEPYRLAGYDLNIDPPIYVPLDIVLTVCVEETAIRSDVQRALLERFGTGRLRNGQKAFFHPDLHSFGDDVYLSQLVAAAKEVPGVAWLDTRPDGANRFQRMHEAPLLELEEGHLPIHRLEVARLENDPNQPELGQIQFHLRGGL